MSRMTDEELWNCVRSAGDPHRGSRSPSLVGVEGIRAIESEARRRAFADVESSCCHKKLVVKESTVDAC